MHFFPMALCLYSQALRYNWSLIHFYSIIQRWRKWVPFYWIAVKISVKDACSFWCLGWGCAFHTLDVEAKMLTLGSVARCREPSSQMRKDFSGLFLSSPASFHPSSTATTCLCLPRLPCPPPHAAVPHPCAISGPVLLLVLSGGFLSLPFPHHHPHIWLLSFLHLNAGIFLLHIVSPQWISPRVQKRQTPGSPFRCLALL